MLSPAPRTQTKMRELSALLSPSTVRSVAVGAPNELASRGVQLLISNSLMLPGEELSVGLRRLVQCLESTYRTEQVYKNRLVSKLLFGVHKVSTATILQEFRVESSVADAVLINGSGHVFEIKTELDNSIKLAKQLADYQRAFRLTSIVTHHSLAEKYANLVAGTKVGLVVWTPRKTLSTRVAAVESSSHLDVMTMMRCLRKDEYADIVHRVTGRPIDVPNTQRFRAYAEASREIPPKVYSVLMEGQLRKRGVAAPNLIGDKRLIPIRAAVLKVNPSSAQMDRILRWLDGGQ